MYNDNGGLKLSVVKVCHLCLDVESGSGGVTAPLVNNYKKGE
jgi:hypothetical protein